MCQTDLRTDSTLRKCRSMGLSANVRIGLLRFVVADQTYERGASVGPGRAHHSRDRT